MHLHVHVIPRYLGDVDDPRGGIRHLMPGKGNYLAPAHAPLVTGEEKDPFLRHLQPLWAGDRRRHPLGLRAGERAQRPA